MYIFIVHYYIDKGKGSTAFEQQSGAPPLAMTVFLLFTVESVNLTMSNVLCLAKFFLSCFLDLFTKKES